MPRRTSRRSSVRLAFLPCLVMFLFASACGGDGGDDDAGQTASDTTTSSTSQAPTSSEPASSPERSNPGPSPRGATGAPLKIPRIQQVGAPLDADLLESLREQFRREMCGGGALCVTLQPVDQAGRRLTPPRDECTFSRTDPPASSSVRQGSTVRLVFTCRPDGTPGDSQSQSNEQGGNT